MAAEKNSLVANINRRKKAGKSRRKSRSTISKSSYEQMEAGWPAQARKTRKKASKKPAKKVRKKATKKPAKKPRASPSR